MAKIRGVKPEFWTDEDIVDLSLPARLVFIGLWNLACDNGHVVDKPKQIKMRLLPADDVDMDALLAELASNRRIERESGIITIPKFAHHQRPHRRWWTTCDLPLCKVPDDAPEQGFNRGKGGSDEGAQPLDNGGATGDHGGTTADGDGDGEVMVKGDGEARGGKSKRGSQFPTNFAPNDTHHKIAADEGVDIRREFVKFREHHTAKGSTFKDWPAAFRSWLHKAGEYRGGNVRQIPQAPRTDEHGQPLLPPLPSPTEWMSR